MAGLIYDVDIPAFPLQANQPTVVCFVTAPPNQRVKVRGYGFFFDGTNNYAAPVEIKLARTAVPLSGVAGTPIKVVQGLPETPQAVTGLSAAAQPTAASLIVHKTITVHPQQGYEYLSPLDETIELAGGTTWLASITALAPVNVRGYFRAEE